jgi:hypothetical protein
MKLMRMLLLVAPLALAACVESPVAPAMDCSYDKTAANAPGYQVCTPAPVISADQSGAQ